MVEAVVECDYIGKEADELTIKKGDVIKEVVRNQPGWYIGSLNNRRGLFPDNFVRIMEEEVKLRMDAQNIRKCRVVFSYKQEHEDELNLNVGDIIDILGEEEEGWWRGSSNGKLGVFPSNFVEEIPISNNHHAPEVNDGYKEAAASPAKHPKVFCEVKYEYIANNDDELTLKEGDIITLLSKEGQDAGWWKGELNGKVGVFPDNFVVIIDADKSRKQTDNKDSKVKYPAKSLDKGENSVLDGKTNIPPVVPNKKPNIPIKKSPSGSGGGLLSGLRKKIVDAVDGSSSSKSLKITSSETKPEVAIESYSAFDQVERSAILQDVRASRAKAPGRRPPSAAIKESDAPVIVNGNSDYGSLEENLSNSNTSIEQEPPVVVHQVKPKMREWEKHKAPWLEEMKMNQAKRTSTSPGPETRNRLLSNDSSDEKQTEPIADMSKSMPNVMKRTPEMEKSPRERTVKTPPNDLEKDKVVLRNKPTINARPTTIEASVRSSITKTSPTILHKTPPSPPASKPALVEKPTMTSPERHSHETIATKQYADLLERLCNLEKQNETQKAAIEDLRVRLQVETDMRMLLQAELEKVSQCVMQV